MLSARPEPAFDEFMNGNFPGLRKSEREGTDRSTTCLLLFTREISCGVRISIFAAHRNHSLCDFVLHLPSGSK
jgi:hypothetical protein